MSSVKTVITAEKGLKSPLLSQGIVHNGTIYVSGHIGLNTETMQVVEGSVADRTVSKKEPMYHSTDCIQEQALLNLETVLKAAGSSLANMVKVRAQEYAARVWSLTYTTTVQHLPNRHGRLCCHECSLYARYRQYTWDYQTDCSRH